MLLKKTMGKTVAASILATASMITAAASAAPAAQKSKVEAKVEPSKSGLAFHFHVVPDTGLHINQEGPWQLEIKAAPGLTFASTTLKKDAVDFALPGFTLATTVPPSQSSGSVTYKLIAFVCTNDKAQCFRDVLNGEVAWKR
ncbi:MAG: hypothetical protein NTZ90_17015 [Proteobacteria bacterium]|nr:hypothetical protein [Pseudomonadota bacterium]